MSDIGQIKKLFWFKIYLTLMEACPADINECGKGEMIINEQME